MSVVPASLRALDSDRADLINVLETMIDRHRLSEVLSALSYICDEKAQHIAVNYQDVVRGKLWLKMAVRLDPLTARAEQENL